MKGQKEIDGLVERESANNEMTKRRKNEKEVKKVSRTSVTKKCVEE